MKTPKDLEEPADMCVGIDVVEPTNKELDVIELDLANVVELADVGEEHKHLRSRMKKLKEKRNLAKEMEEPADVGVDVVKPAN